MRHGSLSCGKLASGLVALAVLIAGAATAESAPTRPQPILDVSSLADHGAWHDRVMRDAEAFEMAQLSSRDDILASLAAVAAPTPLDLAQGWASQAALIGVSHPKFAEGVRKTARRYGRDAVIANLREDPSYARQLPAGQDVRARIVRASAQDAETLRNAAARLKSQAYVLQAYPMDLRGEAAAAEQLAVMDDAERQASMQVLNPIHGDSLEQRAAAHAVAPGPRSQPFVAVAQAFSGGASERNVPKRTHVGAVDGALTLAALTILSDARTGDVALYRARQVERCAAMADLQVKGCIAVARHPSEDLYCLAQHGLRDMAGCFDASP